MKNLILLITLQLSLFAHNFHLIKHESNITKPTLLVIGGIHGNEPGGYNAANILATHYTITKGSVWVVPNLNKASITRNRRGFYGDMNRKFAKINPHDHDYKIVQDIKKIILNPQVDLILNLHDGHGFYRKKYKNTIFNPNAWGQTCVIDQANLDNCPFGNLNTIASNVANSLNSKLIQDHHSFNVKNTKTKFYDEQMKLSLTFFAVRHKKPAFAIETSKDLHSTAQKVYYQLLAIESFMHQMNIQFKRDFTLNENNIKYVLHDYGKLQINNNISLDLENIRSYLSYIPIKSKDNNFLFSNYLGNVKKDGSNFGVYIGSRRVVLLKPQSFKLCKTKSITLLVDGVKKIFPIPSTFTFKHSFKVMSSKDIRINVIGFQSKKSKNENNILVHANLIDSYRSIDKNKTKYRVEIYKGKRFCGMLIAKKKRK